MSENYRQSEITVLFNNKFKLNLLQFPTFWLIYVTVTIQSILLWPESRHGDVCATDLWHRQ